MVLNRHISLGFLTVVDASPPDMVSIAAEAGYQGVSLMAGPMFMAPNADIGAPVPSLVEDDALRRETVQRAKDTGVTLDLMEGFILSPTFDLERCRIVFDLTAGMGISQMGLLDADPDRGRAAESLSAMCEMAAARNMGICLEFHSRYYPPSSAAGAELVASGRYPRVTLVVDALHLARGGETPADVAKIAPEFIGCTQISDGPATVADTKAYAYESVYERQIPGEGALPLTDLLQAIPARLPHFLEVPLRKLREQGVSPLERARRIIAGMRRVMDAA